jgi:hypothetical protein
MRGQVDDLLVTRAGGSETLRESYGAFGFWSLGRPSRIRLCPQRQVRLRDHQADAAETAFRWGSLATRIEETKV